MSKFITRNGEPTTAEDPSRLLWYGLCTYWTDDWDHVASTSIPSCPKCGCPGFQATAENWLSGAELFAKDHPDYVHFLVEARERCYRKPWTFLKVYEHWLANNKQFPSPIITP